jgi:hypothetical protein
MKKYTFWFLLLVSPSLLAQTSINEIEGIWHSSDINGYILIRIVNNTVVVIDLDRKSPRKQALEGIIEDPGIEYFTYVGEVNFDIEPLSFSVQTLKSIGNENPPTYSMHSLFFSFNTLNLQNHVTHFSDCCPVCSCPTLFGGRIEKVF